MERENGYQRLNEGEAWDIRQDGKYYVTRNDSSIIALHIGSKLEDYSFKIAASHSDSPTFKIKENAEIQVKDRYMKLNTEGYGGMLWVKEIVAYKKLYGNKKEVSFIALGGNENYDTEEVEDVTVLKCSWTALLMAAISIKSQFERISYSDEHVAQTIRILKYIEKSFEAHKVYSLSTLDHKALARFHSYSDNLLLKFTI